MKYGGCSEEEELKCCPDFGESEDDDEEEEDDLRNLVEIKEDKISQLVR